ncbi:MAG: transporter substrate-binding domain-containing protein, partial [Methylocella sp.]
MGFAVANFKRKLASIALLALLALAPRAAAAGGGVFVPGFWDPHYHPAKPDLTGLRSLRFLTEDDYPPFHFALPDG